MINQITKNVFRRLSVARKVKSLDKNLVLTSFSKKFQLKNSTQNSAFFALSFNQALYRAASFKKNQRGDQNDTIVLDQFEEIVKSHLSKPMEFQMLNDEFNRYVASKEIKE